MPNPVVQSSNHRRHRLRQDSGDQHGRPPPSDIFCHSIKASNTASQALSRRSKMYHRQHPPLIPQETAKPACPNILHNQYDAHPIQIQETQPRTGTLGSLVQLSERGLFDKSSNRNVFQVKARRPECSFRHTAHCPCVSTHRSIDKMKQRRRGGASIMEGRRAPPHETHGPHAVWYARAAPRRRHNPSSLVFCIAGGTWHLTWPHQQQPGLSRTCRLKSPEKTGMAYMKVAHSRASSPWSEAPPEDHSNLLPSRRQCIDPPGSIHHRHGHDAVSDHCVYEHDQQSSVGLVF